MATSGWLAVAGACPFYIAMGLWAISQIFPTDHDAPPAPRTDRQEGNSGT